MSPVFLNMKSPLRVRDLGIFSPIDIAAALKDESTLKRVTDAWVSSLSDELAASVWRGLRGIHDEEVVPESRTEVVSDLLSVPPSSASDAMYGGDARDGAPLGDPASAFALVADAIRAGGHDGLIYSNEVEGQRGDDSYVILDPNQAKSAIGNRGTFDSKDSNILHGFGAASRWMRTPGGR